MPHMSKVRKSSIKFSKIVRHRIFHVSVLIFTVGAIITGIIAGTRIVSSSSEVWDYQWLRQSYAVPSNPDTNGTLTMTIRNTGNTTWTNTSDANTIRLGTSRGRDRSSDLYHSSWLSSNRVTSFAGKATLDGSGNLQYDGSGNVVYDNTATTIAPGEVAHFSFSIKTPNRPVSTNEYFSPVVDGRFWLKDIGIYWPLSIAQGYSAQFVGQSAYPTIDKGTNPAGTIHFDYKNTGSFTWYKNGAVSIGTSRDRDRSSGFVASDLGGASQPALPANTANWISSNRAATLSGKVTAGVLDASATAIAPGETARFIIPIDTRGITASTYREYFQPVADGFAWLVDVGAYQDITVANNGSKVAAAGDIACDPASGSFNGGAGIANECKMSDTADLVNNGGFSDVLLLGDNQYDTGTLAMYNASYDLSWGNFIGITRPSPGNHEYKSGNANGYYSYFGAAAGDPTKGYYSFDIGTWHIIALNSNCSHIGGCQAGSAQETWLRADLAANPNICTLAYWHHPRFSSGTHTNDATFDAFWDALYEYQADVVLNGHSHVYERFSRQTPDAVADANGIREFVVGTGGQSISYFPDIKANSASRGDSFGILSLRLSPYSYEWQFLPTSGTFSDRGSTACH